MALKKEWIKKIDEKELEYYLNKNDFIQKVPDYNDRIIINKFKNTKTYQKDRSSFFNFFLTNYKFGVISITILLIIFSTTFIYLLYNSPDKNLIKNSFTYNGSVEVIRKNNNLPLKNSTFLKEKDQIKTNSNSYFRININDKTKIVVSQDSFVEVTTLSKEKNNEINKFYLKKGKIKCNVTLSTKNSVFQILTNTSTISVVGTIFTVEVFNNNDVKVEVEKGKVEVKDFIKTEVKLNPNIPNADEVNKILSQINEQKIMVNQNEKLLLNKDNLDSYNKNLDELIKVINESGKTDHMLYDLRNLKKYDYKNIGKSDESEEGKNNNNTNENNKAISIEKLPNSPQVELEEINTSVTTNGEYILISSNATKSIYCIDTKDGSLKWTFMHPDLDMVTSSAISYDNKIVFTNPTNIFILDKKGKIESIKKISDGIIFWSEPIIINNLLYIPTSSTIYTYDGKTINELENFSKVNGQLYLSNYQDDLFIFNLNEKDINVYNLNQKNIIFTTKRLLNRAYMFPNFYQNYIYIGDSLNNIYKVDFINKNPNPEIRSINSGITSNLIFYKNNIFFISNDGYFYIMDAIKFDKPTKLVKVDSFPNSNKYLTKKLMIDKNDLYFCSDTGKIFNYNLITNKYDFLVINENIKNNLLIGTPVKINNDIFVVDKKTNIYKLVKN